MILIGTLTPEHELGTASLFYAMTAVAIFSLIPFSLKKGVTSLMIWLPPLISLIFWVVYEIILADADMIAPIRLDIALLFPVFCIPVIASLIRFRIVIRRRNEASIEDIRKKLRHPAGK